MAEVKSSCRYGLACPITRICLAACASAGRKEPKSVDLQRGVVHSRIDYGGMMVLRKGILASISYTPRGKRFAHLVIGRGMALGEVTVFSAENVNDSLLAFSDVEACIIPTERIRSAVRANPLLLHELLDAAAASERSFGLQAWMLQGPTVRDKIERFFSACAHQGYLQKERGGLIPVSQENIALVINADRVSVSRALKQLEAESLITVKRGGVLLQDSYRKHASGNSENVWDASVSIIM